MEQNVQTSQRKIAAGVIGIDNRRSHDRHERLEPPGDRGVPRERGKGRWAVRGLSFTHKILFK